MRLCLACNKRTTNVLDDDDDEGMETFALIKTVTELSLKEV